MQRERHTHTHRHTDPHSPPPVLVNIAGVGGKESVSRFFLRYCRSWGVSVMSVFSHFTRKTPERTKALRGGGLHRSPPVEAANGPLSRGRVPVNGFERRRTQWGHLLLSGVLWGKGGGMRCHAFSHTHARTHTRTHVRSLGALGHTRTCTRTRAHTRTHTHTGP